MSDWYKVSCEDCGDEIPIHRDWDNPPTICQSCKAKRAAQWYERSCADCGTTMKLHRDWDNPPSICQSCKAKRAAQWYERSVRPKVTAHMGDIFEGGADLTILPCGAKPTWTGSVSRWIDQFGLPTPKQIMPEMKLGDVTAPTPFPGPQNITKFVAYGASVLNDQTTPEVICKLGANIGRLTRSYLDIRTVESVLFGTGHGKLDDKLAAESLTKGFVETANPSAKLWIFVHGNERYAGVQKVVEHALVQDETMLEKFKDIRIAVIVALAEEYDIFCRYFHGAVIEKFHVGDLTIDILERDDRSERIGLVSVNRMGNIAAAIAATRLLEVFDLDLVANIGLAAGIDKEKQALGDIVVAEKVRYYETGKMRANSFEIAPEFSDLHSSFVQALQTANVASWPLGASVGGKPRKVFFGTVASGEKVIASSDFVQSLLSQDRKTIGIEMESYGIAAAIHGRKEKLLLIRGICDFGDETKNDDGRLSAMEGAVCFFNEAMLRGLLRPPVPSPVLPRPSVVPQEYVLSIMNREVREGIANNYVQISRSKTLDVFRYRKSVIQKMAENFTLGDLRIFCISLTVDFDEIRGETKTEKAAGILEFVERKGLLSVEELESLIDGE